MSSWAAMRLLMSKIVASHACRRYCPRTWPGILNGDRSLGCEHREFAVLRRKVSPRLGMRNEQHAHEPVAVQEGSATMANCPR